MGAARMGHFGLLQKIGEGGMGVVYKARDTRLERVVAIKLLPESRATDAERRSRFIHEAKAASALNHPNIVAIHEVGEQDGRTFMVMEFVDGKQLSELIPRKGMRLTEALRVAVQVADALTAAHASGHRASRSEARQYHGGPAGSGQSAGFRAGQGSRAGGRLDGG